jgi:hypothetical protein
MDMAKTWVLDTETKGTGAHIAPLEKAGHGQPERELSTVTLQRPPRPAEPPAPPEPLRFKVVDILSDRVLGEGIDARATVELLEGERSALDVRIWVWAPSAGRWRLLTLAERNALWQFRGRAAAA